MRMTLEQAQAAADAWGFNCGPGAACGVLGLTPDEIRPDLCDFEAKGYTDGPHPCNVQGMDTEHDAPVRYAEVPGFPGYRVGSDGSVWTRLIRRPGRPTEIGEQWKPFKGSRDKDGYHQVNLREAGTVKTFRVATLVLAAFVSSRPPGMVVCHEDGDTDNNDVSNLRWDTQRSNIADKSRHRTMATGEKNGNSKLSKELVAQMRSKARVNSTSTPREGLTQQQLAAQFDVSLATVRQVLSGRTWQDES